MPLIGGGKKAKKTSSSTKRHFTVVMGNKEHGLYVSSSPSSAARKAVSKLCATDKKRKVQFQIRETTQKSIKKTYGPYLGYIEKLAKPIELKGRVIKYKPVAKLIGKKTKTGGAKKRGSILVVEAKDGKVIKKYITKKEADKHMKQRHKRLDKYGIKKTKKKSMRGGGIEIESKFDNKFTINITKEITGNGLIRIYINLINKQNSNSPPIELSDEGALEFNFNTNTSSNGNNVKTAFNKQNPSYKIEIECSETINDSAKENLFKVLKKVSTLPESEYPNILEQINNL